MRNIKTWAASFCLAAAFIGSSGANANEASTAVIDRDLTGEQVLTAYIEALGGERALASVESLQRQGELVVESPIMGISKGRFETTVVAREAVHRASDLGAFSTTAAWDGEVAWERGPRGLRTLEGEELRQIRSEAELFYFTGLWRPESLEVERMPDEPLDGVDHWVVELSQEGRPPMTAYIDPETALLAQVVHTVHIPGLGDTVAVSDFWDYSEESGVMMPAAVGFSIEGVFSSEVVFDKTVVNPAVDRALFARPR